MVQDTEHVDVELDQVVGGFSIWGSNDEGWDYDPEDPCRGIPADVVEGFNRWADKALQEYCA